MEVDLPRSGQNLTEFPERFAVDVTSLNLRGNRLTTLPSTTAERLVNLRKLDLGGNPSSGVAVPPCRSRGRKIDQPPDTAKRLEVIPPPESRSLPDTVGSLINLQGLYLWDNPSSGVAVPS